MFPEILPRSKLVLYVLTRISFHIMKGFNLTKQNSLMKTINFTIKKLILQNDKSEELMTKISGRQL